MQLEDQDRSDDSDDLNNQSDPFLLDDPIEEFKELSSAENNQEGNYDLNKGLSVRIVAYREMVQLSKTNPQKLRSLISLRTLEVTNQENQDLQELSSSENRG